MAKIKLTRKSYKRNIIVFGVMLFMGIALVSTGFATWVLSQNTQIEVNGQNVNVGVVSDNALKISGLKFHYNLLQAGTDENGQPKYEYVEQSVDTLEGSIFGFNFEPFGGDVTGKVKWDVDGYNTKSINYEVLTLTVKGVINPVDYINTFEITLRLPEGIVNLAEAGFITLPELAQYDKAEDGSITFKPYVIADEDVEFNDGYSKADVFTIDANGNFTLTIAFKWGEKFGGVNPSEYFDSKEFTAAPSDWETNITEDREYLYIKYCLQELRKQVHGCTYMSLNGNEYEVYQDGTNWYVLNNDGSYSKATVTNGNLTAVENTVAAWEPVKPQFDIKINITAN